MGRKKRVFIVSIIGAVVIAGAVAGALSMRQRDTPVNVGTTTHNDTDKQQATHREIRVISTGLNTPITRITPAAARSSTTVSMFLYASGASS